MTIDLDGTSHVIGLLISCATLATFVFGWIRYGRPKVRRGYQKIVAIFDAILGRDPIYDSITGEERVPALPGIGVRMASTEANVAALVEAVAELTRAHLRFDALEKHVANLDERTQALEQASVERVVTKVESAQAWRTIEKAIQAEPTHDDKPDL